MATLTAASEIQAKLNAAIAALSPSHRHLYISSLMLVSPILPPGVNSSGLPYQVRRRCAFTENGSGHSDRAPTN
jgi:hypothetical protein